MSGRAAGRARGRPSAGGDSPTSGSGSPTGSGSPVASQTGANRGRGGYRSELVTTRPPDVKVTTGEGGRPVNLFANYFRVEIRDESGVWDYRVDFEPEIESVKVRRALVQTCAARFNNAYLFDGMSNLKALVALDPANLVTTVDTVNQAAVAADGGVAPHQKIHFRRSEAQIAWGSFEMMRLYNTQMRCNFQHLNWMLIYRDFYDPSTRIEMTQFSIDVMLGLRTAINNHDAGILVAAETINKIIRRDTVLTVMRQIHGRGGNFQDNVRRELVGSIVMTKYNNRTYKIDDIDFAKNPDSQFERRGLGMVSFASYYQQQYQLTVADRLQPLIVCLPSKRDLRAAEQRGQQATTHLLVPEFCVMTGLSESLRGNFDLKKQLTQRTQLAPQDRHTQLTAFRAALQANQNVQNDMNLWGLRYSNQLVSVTGRVLENEKIWMSACQNPASGIMIRDPGDFSKEIRTSRMQVAKTWSRWAVVFPGRVKECADDFLNAFKRVSSPLGLQVGQPLLKILSEDRTAAYLSALSELSGADSSAMVVCIVPNNNKDRYDAIKKKCYIESPISSQVILSKTLSKKQTIMSVATKICLQMACKAGSEAWTVHFPVNGIMIVGYDTYHDGARKGESVGAFVATLNNAQARYYSRVSYHKNNEEMSNNIAANLMEALKKYKEANNQLPSKVLIYRDGVGEGMIPHVFEVELDAMKKVLHEVSPEVPIRLSFVIVTKRINTKFFLKNEQLRKLENPVPGTVVDTVVTRPERFEFFLVAQSVRHGTVAPTNFNIICNDFAWQPKHFQMLSYKLCHMYFNWPGTIRVPAPCQYAHKLAFLTGTSLHREPHAALSDRLFFL